MVGVNLAQSITGEHFIPVINPHYGNRGKYQPNEPKCLGQTLTSRLSLSS